MKNLILIASAFIILTSCSKDNVLPGQSYHDASGAFVNFSDIKWYVTKDGTFATLNLKIAGNTNADRFTITTSGDGLLTEVNIPLKSGKFTSDGGIYFTHTAPPAGTMSGSTIVTVYKGADKLAVHLLSNDVNY